MHLLRLTALLLALAALAPTLAWAQAVPADLRDADYITGRDVEAEVPYGELFIEEAVVAIFPGLDKRLAGALIGDAKVTLRKLPKEGALNLLEATGRGRTLKFEVQRAYLSAAHSSDAKVLPTGRALAARRWEQLKPEEQQAFLDIYLQAYSDGWVAEDQSDTHAHSGGAGDSAGQPGFLTLRDPVQKEFFAAFWSDAPAVAADGSAAAEGPTRYDFKVDASGEHASIVDADRNVTLFQVPWAPEEGEVDTATRISQVKYHYTYPVEDPKHPGPRVKVAADVTLSVSEPRTGLRFISYPWLGTPVVKRLSDNQALTCFRGGSGLSNWVLQVDGDFKPGQDYVLAFSFDAAVPWDFQGIGYGGVYRFDTGTLWPGPANATDVEIAVTSPGAQAAFIASNTVVGETLPVLPQSNYASYSWSGQTRNQMLIMTKFPSRRIETGWGALEIFAPADVIDSALEMEGVQALGPIVEFYTSLWGPPWLDTPGSGDGSSPSYQPAQQAEQPQAAAHLDSTGGVDAALQAAQGRRPAAAATDQKWTLPVFFIPDESGVQAFEDAGIVFILGGEQGYGGMGSGPALIAHEVAHLWWGQGFTGPRWFLEGMANYGAAKFIEHYYGDAGPAAGQGDPLSYRRYILNLALGSALPLSLEQRDALDDRAAIYHLSAGALLSMDARLDGGLDPVLRELYERGYNGPGGTTEQLLDYLNELRDRLGDDLAKYVVAGHVPHRAVDDPTYRELAFTPERENYVKLLRWLNPAYGKRARGDYAGALYCMRQALRYRSKPKDWLLLADLQLDAGEPAEADATADNLLESDDRGIAAMALWLKARAARALGHADERSLLERFLEVAAQQGLLREADSAKARLDELSAQS